MVCCAEENMTDATKLRIWHRRMLSLVCEELFGYRMLEASESRC
jgi:hypothetical protein